MENTDYSDTEQDCFYENGKVYEKYTRKELDDYSWLKKIMNNSPKEDWARLISDYTAAIERTQIDPGHPILFYKNGYNAELDAIIKALTEIKNERIKNSSGTK